MMTATLALASEPVAVSADPTMATVRQGAETLLLDIQVLGRPLQGIFEVERAVDGHLIMPADAWSQARLRPSSDAIAMANGQSGYALDAVPGLTYEVDPSQLILKIRAPAAAFDASTVEIYGRQTPALADAAPGAYLDYEASATHAGERNSFGAVVEGVVFNGGSALVAGAVIRGDDRQTDFVRTDTYWRKDFPQRMEVLVIGDALGSGGLWSVPVRFGGVRFARDFSQAPGFITYPIPSISGEAGLPSTVDVLINNQVSASTSVPAGPFALTNVPMMNGAGEMQVVVRDLLGRETLIQQSYYVAPQLLSRDLSDFAFDAGAMRAQYGTASNDYGSWFGAATYRRGINDWLTGEVRAELQHDRQAAGAGINLLSGQLGVISQRQPTPRRVTSKADATCSDSSVAVPLAASA